MNLKKHILNVSAVELSSLIRFLFGLFKGSVKRFILLLGKISLILLMPKDNKHAQELGDHYVLLKNLMTLQQSKL